MKKIGVLTSGGDSPGMNAAIRAVVRTALHEGLEVFGIYDGYSGLLKEDIVKLERHDVSGILDHGGTILKTSRCPEFRDPKGRAQAAETLRKFGIEGLVVVGGDGSFTGAMLLQKEQDIRAVGIPGTIDNDLYGTDYTIGYDTAVNTAIQAVDKIRDTATSHSRIFFVEVMGRDSGYIAIPTAISCGAEAVAIPEDLSSVDRILDHIEQGRTKMNKSSSIVITAEGKTAVKVADVVKKLEERINNPDVIRYIQLGHIQRGGSPTAADRVLASRVGSAAVMALNGGAKAITIGIINDKIVETPIEEAITKRKPISKELLSLVDILA